MMLEAFFVMKNSSSYLLSQMEPLLMLLQTGHVPVIEQLHLSQIELLVILALAAGMFDDLILTQTLPCLWMFHRVLCRQFLPRQVLQTVLRNQLSVKSCSHL